MTKTMKPKMTKTVSPNEVTAGMTVRVNKSVWVKVEKVTFTEVRNTDGSVAYSYHDVHGDILTGNLKGTKTYYPYVLRGQIPVAA